MLGCRYVLSNGVLKLLNVVFVFEVDLREKKLYNFSGLFDKID